MTAAQARRRVLLVTHDLEPWGAQRQLVELAKGLDAERYEVHVAALAAGGALAAELQAARIPIVYFERRWRWDLTPIVRLLRWLRQERIDVVHSFMFLPGFYARFAARLARTPAVICSLRSASVAVEGWPRFALDVATCFLCDAMVANSKAGLTLYRRYGGLASRTLVIPNGLPAAPQPSAAEVQRAGVDWHLQHLQPRLGMVAAFESRKDHALLVRALPMLLPQYPNLGLVLAGDGSQRARVEALVDSLHLRPHVVFLGRVRAALVYPLLDVYVQSSGSGEGISNSILEAMQHGLPVVATDVGGNSEVVLDNVSGHLVAAGETAQMAAALTALLGDAERRARLGQAGCQRVLESFSATAMAHATAALYERVLAGLPVDVQPPTPQPRQQAPSCSNSAS